MGLKPGGSSHALLLARLVSVQGAWQQLHEYAQRARTLLPQALTARRRCCIVKELTGDRNVPDGHAVSRLRLCWNATRTIEAGGQSKPHLAWSRKTLSSIADVECLALVAGPTDAEVRCLARDDLLMLPQKSGPKIGTALTVACTIVDLGSPVAASAPELSLGYSAALRELLLAN
jgi:hypothetical protein